MVAPSTTRPAHHGLQTSAPCKACVQSVKRLAELALDLDRDTRRLQQSLLAFKTLSAATEAAQVGLCVQSVRACGSNAHRVHAHRMRAHRVCAQVEAMLTKCLVQPLELGSVRLYLVDRATRSAASVSGPPTTTSWRPAAMEQQPSLVAWCGLPDRTRSRKLAK
jgi:hypothetical protein